MGERRGVFLRFMPYIVTLTEGPRGGGPEANQEKSSETTNSNEPSRPNELNNQSTPKHHKKGDRPLQPKQTTRNIYKQTYILK